MYLGIDASTQSVSAVVIDPSSGVVAGRASVAFGDALPDYGAAHGFVETGVAGEVMADPRMWLDGLELCFGRLRDEVDLSRVKAIGGSGQQHGSVYLDETFGTRLAELDATNPLADQLGPALTRELSPIWMDQSTAEECLEITHAAGGDGEVLARTGSRATERFTGPQIRRFFKRSPVAYGRTRRIHLVSSFLSSVLAGRDAPIDFGDGAGMNLMNLARRNWDTDLLSATAPGLVSKLPPLSIATHAHGRVSRFFVEKFGFSADCAVAVFTGDNPASLVGMGASRPGPVVISLGTSDTWFRATAGTTVLAGGMGHVFGNPAGGGMSLVCFANGSLAREKMRDELGGDWAVFEDAAGCAADGGNLMLPFFVPEITPPGAFGGPLRRGDDGFMRGENPAKQARAFLEGQFLNMRCHAGGEGTPPERILLTGGASRNAGIARVAADVLQAPVERLDSPDSAALGAAMIAACADGRDMAALESAYCRPVEGTRIVPDVSLAAHYRDALGRFREFLRDVLAAM